MLKLYNMKIAWMVLFILWTLLLLVVTLIPDSSKVILDTGSDFRWDYIEHLLAYFVFGSLFILWRSNARMVMRWADIVLLLSITFVFSVITEYAQILIPGRTFNFIDMFYNLGGLIISILITYLVLIRLLFRRILVE